MPEIIFKTMQASRSFTAAPDGFDNIGRLKSVFDFDFPDVQRNNQVQAAAYFFLVFQHTCVNLLRIAAGRQRARQREFFQQFPLSDCIVRSLLRNPAS